MGDWSERWWELWAEHVCIRIKKKGGYRRPPSSLVLKWEVVGVTDGGSPVQPLAIPPDRWRLTFDQPSSCHRWPSFHHQLSFHRLNHNKWRAGSTPALPLTPLPPFSHLVKNQYFFNHWFSQSLCYHTCPEKTFFFFRATMSHPKTIRTPLTIFTCIYVFMYTCTLIWDISNYLFSDYL